MLKRNIRVGMKLFVPKIKDSRYGSPTGRIITVTNMDDVSVLSEGTEGNWYLFSEVIPLPVKTECAHCAALEETTKLRAKLKNIHKRLTESLDALGVE